MTERKTPCPCRYEFKFVTLFFFILIFHSIRSFAQAVGLIFLWHFFDFIRNINIQSTKQKYLCEEANDRQMRPTTTEKKKKKKGKNELWMYRWIRNLFGFLRNKRECEVKRHTQRIAQHTHHEWRLQSTNKEKIILKQTEILR